MINYGAGPLADEIEVTVFGPGFGEAIAVHLGRGRWMLVDSCLSPSKVPAALQYLERIGVNAADAVVSIVASHWHDDHVRGLSQIAAACRNSEIHISGVFNDAETLAFLVAHSGVIAARKLTRGTKELHNVLRLRDGDVRFSQQRSIVYESNDYAPQVRVVAMSPVQAALTQNFLRLAGRSFEAGEDSAIGNAPELKPNTESVVIHVDWGHESALLGADLEEDPTLGWTAIATDHWCQNQRKAAIFKVAHHGANSGHSDAIWTELVRDAAIACLTPFSLGRQRLPTDSDKARIRALTPHAYISSGATRKPDIQSDQLKRLGDSVDGLAILNPGFGAVRLRKTRGAPGNWGVERFGHAQAL